MRTNMTHVANTPVLYEGGRPTHMHQLPYTPMSIKRIVSECRSFETDKLEAMVSNINLHPDNICHMTTFLIKTNLINSVSSVIYLCKYCILRKC